MTKKVKSSVHKNRQLPTIQTDESHMNADARLISRNLSKEEFGLRLHALMGKRQWRQSDLARHAGMNRDSISTYVNGKAFPTPTNLAKLAAAFEVRPEELLPNNYLAEIDKVPPAFSIRSTLDNPNRVHLQIDRLVSMTTAVKIAAILEEDHASD